jgi:predicted O-methyltransferase YrrM
MDILQYIDTVYSEAIIFDEIEKKIISFARKNSIPYLLPVKGKILSCITRLKNPKNILEIGLGSGFSTYILLKSTDDNSKIISIDFNFFRINDFFENIFKQLPEKYKTKLTVYPLDIFYALDKFMEIEKKFDLIFLDSTKRDYLELLPLLVEILDNNGILLCDNITYGNQTFKNIAKRSENYLQGVELLHKFNKKLLSYDFLHTCFIPVADGMSLSIKTSEDKIK